MADVLEELNANQGFKQTAKDLFSGAVGGIAQVLIGQPFDIVKVRLQTTDRYKGAVDAATQIFKNEGPSAFYKGTLTPLIGIGACVSVQFGAFNYAKRAFEARNAAVQHKPLEVVASQPKSLSYGQYYMAGAFAGIANTALSTPIEHVRIRLQTQPHGADRLYSGPLDCIRKLGGAGIYRGTSVTLLREAQAYGAWFLTFEYLMNQDAKRYAGGRKEIPTWKIAFYGAIAGEMLWLTSYPFDVVKSKMQTDGFGQQQRYKTMRDAFAQTFRQEGFAGFWRGLGPTLLRAAPVSGGTFAVVELTMRLIS